MDKIELVINNISNAQNAYAGTGMMMALFFFAVLILVFYCKDKRIRIVLLPLFFIMIVLYICVPLFNTFKYYLETYDGRMFWALITPIIISVGFTVFVSGINEKNKRIIITGCLVLVFLMCGEFKISSAMFERNDNLYKLPQATVDISEYVTARKDEPRLIVPYTIAHPFRQITTKIHLLYGEDATSGRIFAAPDEYRVMCEEMEHVTPNLEYVIPLGRENKVDYILFDTVYTELCENGNINIYNYPIDENYVGDRTSTVSFGDLKGVSVIDDELGVYWDLSQYGLVYEKTFGQYILYSFQ